MTNERLGEIKDWLCDKMVCWQDKPRAVVVELIEALEEEDELTTKYAAELNRRRSTDSAVRQTLADCGAPGDLTIHSQIEWLAKRSVRRLRTLERVASYLRLREMNCGDNCFCERCRLLESVAEAITGATK